MEEREEEKKKRRRRKGSKRGLRGGNILGAKKKGEGFPNTRDVFGLMRGGR